MKMKNLASPLPAHQGNYFAAASLIVVSMYVLLITSSIAARLKTGHLSLLRLNAANRVASEQLGKPNRSLLLGSVPYPCKPCWVRPTWSGSVDVFLPSK